MLDAMQVGNKIATYRKNNKMSQEDLAEKLFVTRQALSKWETGIAIPSVDTLLDICKIFNVSFEEILCLDEEIFIDKDNIFQGHSRSFIIKKIINNEIIIDIPSIFYQLSPEERMLVLKSIKEGKIKVNYQELICRLTQSERKYLGGEIVCF